MATVKSETSRRFARGTDFPHEGFVQHAIERYFSEKGFAIDTEGVTDLVCRHPDTHECWEIEAKGTTTAVGLDFRTGLGQLIQRSSQASTCRAIAFPDTPQFTRQYTKVQPWVRTVLNLYWLLVHADGTVTVISPTSE